MLFDNLKYKIFCDMDGVLVDFEKGYLELTGKDISGEWHTTTEFWDPINKEGSKFWDNLEWMKDGKKLWSYIEEQPSEGRSCWELVPFFPTSMSLLPQPIKAVQSFC